MSGTKQSSCRFFCLLLLLALLLGGASSAVAGEFRLAVMQAQKGAAAKFKPLESYLEKNGIETTIVAPENYPAAARMFAEGQVDGMFSGSGVAGVLLLKKVAYPLVRPVAAGGTSTYWAVVVARKGAPAFDGSADYFKGKRVVCCALASSGEFFLRAIPGAREAAAQVKIAGSHGAAIEAVSKGEADIAIVKNLVWNDVRGNYPALEQVGSDSGQNPDNALIVATGSDKELVKKLMGLLLGLKDDPSPEAEAVRQGLGLREYILTSAADFNHTLSLLKWAGVGPDYDFD